MDDTKAKVISLLREYKNIMPQVKKLDAQMAEMNNLRQMDTLKATTISDMPSVHEISNPTLDLLCRYETDIERYAKQINDLLDTKLLIEDMLNSLDTLQREIIISRYITNPEFRCDIFDWIGCQVNYSRRQVIREYNSAMDKLIEYYERVKEWECA